LLLRRLHYFATVAEVGSISSAAARLRVAQPALSRQLRSLEDEVGSPLVQREARGTRLTYAGRALLADVKAIFADLEATLREVQLAVDGQFGRVRIGLNRDAMDSPLMGQALASLRSTFPKLTLTVSDLADGAQVDALRKGTVDLAIGIGNSPQTADTVVIPLLDVAFDGVLLPDNHPLAKHEVIRPEMLAGERALLVDPSVMGTGQELVEAARRIGAEPELHASASTVVSLVAAGRGWSPASTSWKFRLAARTVVRPLEGLSVRQTLTARARASDESQSLANVVALLRMMAGGTPAAARVDGRRATVRENAGRAIGLEQLWALVAAAEGGSVSEGARRVGVTQSGLSRRLKSLERDIGVPLARRLPTGFELTAAGEVLREGALRLLASVERAIDGARATADVATGRCSIGAISTEFLDHVLVPVIRETAEFHPGVRLEVAEMLSPDQVSALLERRIDIGIAGANAHVTDDESIARFRFGDDSIECALLSEHHPLARRNELEPADLADVPFIFMDRATYPAFHDAVMRALSSIGLEPKINGSFNGARSLWWAALQLGGWTIGARSTVAKPFPGMRAVPIRGFRMPSAMQLLWRVDESNPAVLAVLHSLQRVASKEIGQRGA
jgi:DNA-binding transcriptional LysR family regulator